jgi:hypothetical protein
MISTSAQQQQQQMLPNVVTPRDSFGYHRVQHNLTPEEVHHVQQQQYVHHQQHPHSHSSLSHKIDPLSNAGTIMKPHMMQHSARQQEHQHHPQQQQHGYTTERLSADSSQALPRLATGAEGPAVGDDDQGELTLSEYRKTLEAYIVDNNITTTNPPEQTCLDPDEDDVSCVSFQGGGWPDHPSPTRNSVEQQPEDDSRHDEARPDPPAARKAPTLRRVDRHQSGYSMMSAKTLKSNATGGTLSGMSMLSDMELERATDDEKKKRASISSNCSIMSELTDISNTVDELALYDE